MNVGEPDFSIVFLQDVIINGFPSEEGSSQKLYFFLSASAPSSSAPSSLVLVTGGKEKAL